MRTGGPGPTETAEDRPSRDRVLRRAVGGSAGQMVPSNGGDASTVRMIRSAVVSWPSSGPAIAKPVALR
jgi:hypothetical protein